jgi:hypothetical protein
MFLKSKLTIFFPYYISRYNCRPSSSLVSIAIYFTASPNFYSSSLISCYKRFSSLSLTHPRIFSVCLTVSLFHFSISEGNRENHNDLRHNSLQQSTKRKERDGQGKSAAFRPPVRPSSPPHARTHARGLLSSGTKTKGKRKKQPGTKGRIARISKCQQNTGLKEHRSNMWHTWRHGHSFSIAASHAATTQTKCAHTLSLSLSLSLSLRCLAGHAGQPLQEKVLSRAGFELETSHDCAFSS